MDRIFSRSNDCRPRMRSRSTLECWHSIISLVLLMAYTRVEGGRGRRRAAPGIRAVTRSTGAAGRWPARRHLQAPGLKASATKASGQVAAPVSRHAARAPMGGRRPRHARARRGTSLPAAQPPRTACPACGRTFIRRMTRCFSSSLTRSVLFSSILSANATCRMGAAASAQRFASSLPPQRTKARAANY